MSVATLTYGELLIETVIPAVPLPANTAAVEQADAMQVTKLWLSYDANGEDAQPLLSSLPAGTTLQLESQLDPTTAFGIFLTGNITGEETYIQIPVVAVQGSIFVAGDPMTVTLTTPVPATPGGSYARAEELARILQIPNPTPAQAAAMQRVLDAAAIEITAYLGLDAPLAEPYPALVVEVNLERAVEHWKQEQSPFGIVVMGGELPPGHAGVNAWRRHARTLLPLKRSFGVS